jgi:hypothetical protein
MVDNINCKDIDGRVGYRIIELLEMIEKNDYDDLNSTAGDRDNSRETFYILLDMEGDYIEINEEKGVVLSESAKNILRIVGDTDE